MKPALIGLDFCTGFACWGNSLFRMVKFRLINACTFSPSKAYRGQNNENPLSKKKPTAGNLNLALFRTLLQ